MNKQLLMLLTIATLTHAQDKPETVLVVLPFENATGLASLDRAEAGFPDLLTAAFSSGESSVRVLERKALEKIMAEHALNYERLTPASPETRRLAQLSQARFLLRGSFTGSAGKLTIQAMLYDTESTRLVASPSARGTSRSLGALADQLATAVAEAMDRPIGTTSVTADPAPEVSRHFMQGLGYYHQGQFLKAIPEFMKTLDREPRHADARYWLAKSYGAAGMKENADIEIQEFAKQFPSDPRTKELTTLKGETTPP